jgi:hypothetical protein
MMGQGAFVNAVEGTLRQTRRTLTPESGPTNLSGIIFFSMATSNIAVTNNPFAIPAVTTTPARPFSEFASGLATGKSVDGVTLYEPAGMIPIFEEAAQVPAFSWKIAPSLGHVKGEAGKPDNTPYDTAVVTIENLVTNATRTTATDGGGFFGAVDLTPGSYRAQVGALYFCFSVTPGIVATAQLDQLAPQTSASVAPATPNGQNGWYVTYPSVTLSANDNCSGVATIEYSTDGGQNWLTYSGSFNVTSEGTTTVLYRSTDRAGNAETPKSLTLKVDTGVPILTLSATPSVIWPVTGQIVNVAIDGTGSDSVSGVASVSYVITDEYGTPMNLPLRSLIGSSTSWTEALSVEARRDGTDIDGRTYVVVATLSDVAGNSASATIRIVVPHDQGN